MLTSVFENKSLYPSPQSFTWLRMMVHEIIYFKIVQRRFVKKNPKTAMYYYFTQMQTLQTLITNHISFLDTYINTIRMHSSRMRTGRSLTVCRSLLPGGVSAPGGRCLLWGGVCSGGVCLLWGVCVCSGGCVSALGGVCLLWGGVCSQGGQVSAPRGWYPSMH